VVPPAEVPPAAATVGWARRFRSSSRLLETALIIIVVGSVAAIGSVHPWAYLPLWGASLALGLLLCGRVLLVRTLRARLGHRPLVLHPPGHPCCSPAWLL